MIRVTTFKDRTVAVFGLGASGLATARALADGGAQVAAWDDGAAGREAAARSGFPLVDLAAADWTQFAALVLAPGVPLTHPEPHWTVRKAAAAGVEVIGDVELFFRERAATAPDAPVVAITGTNGKSTTTALIAHILGAAGHDVQLGGNIGRAVLTLEPPAAGRMHVLELSSFQIDLAPSAKPTVAVLLNITPDHIDRHGTVAHYAAVKERLIAGAAVACVGIDDELSSAVAARRRAARRPTTVFSAREGAHAAYGRQGHSLLAHAGSGADRLIATTHGIETLRGAHNAQNALAAVAAVTELLRATGRTADIDWQSVLASYQGLPHRLEVAAKIGPVTFINDSKATNADSTEKALASFERNIHWILGGKPKAGGIEMLRPYFPRIAKAYLIGEATDEFAATLGDAVPHERCGTLEIATRHAAADALAANTPNSVVLLSPACASYDQFPNFEVRGSVFKDLVARIGAERGGT